MFKKRDLLFVFILFIFMPSCSVKYVADYDEEVFKEIILTSKKVDIFFATVIETPLQKRTYKKFQKAYIMIEADLNSLIIRNKIRELNKETVKQLKIALELWQSDKENHRKKNTVKDFIAKKHWQQYRLVFIAMAKAEIAKKK